MTRKEFQEMVDNKFQPSFSEIQTWVKSENKTAELCDFVRYLRPNTDRRFQGNQGTVKKEDNSQWAFVSFTKGILEVDLLNNVRIFYPFRNSTS